MVARGLPADSRKALMQKITFNAAPANVLAYLLLDPVPVTAAELQSAGFPCSIARECSWLVAEGIVVANRGLGGPFYWLSPAVEELAKLLQEPDTWHELPGKKSKEMTGLKILKYEKELVNSGYHAGKQYYWLTIPPSKFNDNWCLTLSRAFTLLGKKVPARVSGEQHLSFPPEVLEHLQIEKRTRIYIWQEKSTRRTRITTFRPPARTYFEITVDEKGTFSLPLVVSQMLGITPDMTINVVNVKNTGTYITAWKTVDLKFPFEVVIGKDHSINLPDGLSGMLALDIEGPLSVWSWLDHRAGQLLLTAYRPSPVFNRWKIPVTRQGTGDDTILSLILPVELQSLLAPDTVITCTSIEKHGIVLIHDRISSDGDSRNEMDEWKPLEHPYMVRVNTAGRLPLPKEWKRMITSTGEQELYCWVNENDNHLLYISPEKPSVKDYYTLKGFESGFRIPAEVQEITGLVSGSKAW